MKKRIFALLLAGLLAASMTSCFQGTSDPQDTNPQQTLPETNPETDPDAPIIFTEVDETVYTLSDNVRLLTEMDSVVGAVVIKTKVTEMHRIKYHDTWSVVEYLGQQYYVLSDSVTNADLMGKSFTACADTTMYVTTDGLNIRKYASAKLESLGTLSANETVTVVATGDGWSKIKFTDKAGAEAFGFVKSEYLSATEYVDPNKIDYSASFTACNPYKTMYVTADTLTIRFNAHADSTEMGTLQKDEEVTVVALGTIGESTWAKIRVVVPADKEGDPDSVYLYYVNAKYLSEIKGGVPVTLEGVIEQWASIGFEKLEAPVTMYICTDSCWIRNTPEVIAQYIKQGDKEIENPDFNGVGNRVKKDALNVVALSSEWAIFTITDKETNEVGYYFVHRSVLTTNASGEPAPLSLEELLASNSGFTACETEGKKLYATASVNCYVSAKTSDNPAAVLTAGTQVTLAATSELGNWYIVKTADNVYYFVASHLFSETAPQG
ncbi:MAG: SH3 domain-containing protein [Clostridia bacterium]|nr:SH3 domain-containing protein [Clostridia bacterium]